MSKKFFDKKIILRVVAGIIALIIAINIFSSAVEWRGYNETKFYKEFAEFKDFTTLSELTEYCDDNKLEYVIKDSKVYVNEFDATFIVSSEGTITPNFNSKLLCYEQLDNEDMSKVKMSAEKIGHKIKYVYTVNDLTAKYTKLDGKFYRMPIITYIVRVALSLALVVLSIAITGISVFVRMADIKTERKKRNPLSDILC